MTRSAFVALCLITAAGAAASDPAGLKDRTILRGSAPAPAEPRTTLWWRWPASRWEHAVAVGNGRLGAMVFGKIARERISISESGAWSGGPGDPNRPEALKALGEVRGLLLAGKVVEAERLANERMIGRPKDVASYQPLGHLLLAVATPAEVFDYRRELDLKRAVARISYRAGDAACSREVFSSAVDQVLAVRLTCDKPGRVAFSISWRSPQRAETKTEANDLVLDGRVDGGMEFSAAARLLPEGGSSTTDAGGFAVKDADAATILVAAGTALREKDPRAAALGRLREAAAKSYGQLRQRHIDDYSRYFDRVELELGPASPLPTNERLLKTKQGGDDPDLLAQYFHFGRYLLISSSRPGGLPANLQGLWAKVSAPWNSAYYLNVNLQANYWPAEPANLAECVEPLFDFLEALRAPGRRTASVHYGARGFVAHHVTDVWGYTAPSAEASWGLWPMGAAWLSRHLWEHYEFGGDRAFLERRAYPVMKEAASFFLDYLFEDARGRLTSGPSVSPENAYRLPNGTIGRLSLNPAMDVQILRDLFSNILQAARILGVDADFQAQADAALRRLPPTQVGRHGQLMEWAHDYAEPDPAHHHFSPLFALYPGHEIGPHATPTEAQAAQVTLRRRLRPGVDRHGWSRAWSACLWARLGDGENALRSLRSLLSDNTSSNLFNLATRRQPVFQIDGNLAATAAVAEMLLQSHQDEISLLPALPRAWAAGRVEGLRARGGFVVGMSWKSGKLVEARIRSLNGGRCRVRAGALVKELDTAAGKTYELAEF